MILIVYTFLKFYVDILLAYREYKLKIKRYTDTPLMMCFC